MNRTHLSLAILSDHEFTEEEAPSFVDDSDRLEDRLNESSSPGEQWVIDLRASWHHKPLLPFWVYIVDGQPEGFGLTADLAFEDALRRCREIEAPGESPAEWEAHLQRGWPVQIAVASLDQAASILLHWANPDPEELTSWLRSLTRTQKLIYKASRLWPDRYVKLVESHG